jgi:hypothetical protein
METLEAYWQAVQYKVCVNCIDSDGHGTCRLRGEEECGLKTYFPQIIGAILSVVNTRIEPYVDALRKKVCSFCRHQTHDGRCSFRARLDCGLDRYFPLIVEAVEEVSLTEEKHSDMFGDEE